MTNGPQLLVGKVMHRRSASGRATASSTRSSTCSCRLRDLAAGNVGIFSVDRANLLSLRQRTTARATARPLLPWIQALLRERGLPD